MSGKTLSLEDFERRVYSGDYNTAVHSLTKIIEGIESRKMALVLDDVEESEREGMVTRTYSRLAAAITSMFCDPNFNLDEQGFEILMLRKRFISTLFEATTLQNMEHIMALAAQPVEGGQLSFTSNGALLKGLFACTLDFNFPGLPLVIEKVPLKIRTMFWLSLLDREYFLTESEERAREQVIGLSSLVEDGALSEKFLVRLSNTWMNSSYYNCDTKHDLKLPLNKILSNSMRKLGIRQPPVSDRTKLKDKPTLVVLSEAFTSNHAMYRCYAWAVQQLGELFRLVLVGTESSMDDTSKKMFDEVVSFAGDEPHKKIIGKIVKLQPDVIYYPSLGMQLWTTMASQMRLAPIQLMTLGHPATSMSEFIDYVVVRERSIGDPGCFSETVVLTENDAFSFTLHPDFSKPDKQVPVSESTIKIAVPSTGHKINSALLRCCEEVVRRSSKPVEFRFFPNMSEVNMLVLKMKLEKLLPCTLYDYTDYVTYLKNLSECDIQLSPFPFGNANGYVDGLLVGLPIVSMDGREVHSHADNQMGKLAGLPDYCLTSTEEEYIDGILHLVENDAERHAVSKKLKETDLESLFFNTEVSNDFCTAVRWIYEHHEKIKDDGRKCWSIADRELLG